MRTATLALEGRGYCVPRRWQPDTDPVLSGASTVKGPDCSRILADNPHETLIRFQKIPPKSLSDNILTHNSLALQQLRAIFSYPHENKEFWGEGEG